MKFRVKAMDKIIKENNSKEGNILCHILCSHLSFDNAVTYSEVGVKLHRLASTAPLQSKIRFQTK